MNLNDIKKIFANNIWDFIKDEFIENLKYYYDYKDIIVDLVEKEEQKERDGETFTVRVAENVEKANPEDLKNFLARKLLEDFVVLIQENIEKWWEIRLKKEVSEATNVLFNK